MARVIFVKKARKAKPENGIKKGDSYYWWKFRFGAKHYSKTSPKRSQLTQSPFFSSLWDLQDDFKFDQTDLEGSKNELVGEIESLRDECQSSLDNMPEQLQESSASAEMLRERIDALDDWISQLESVDLDIDEELSDEEKEARIDSIIEELEGCECGI